MKAVHRSNKAVCVALFQVFLNRLVFLRVQSFEDCFYLAFKCFLVLLAVHCTLQQIIALHGFDSLVNLCKRLLIHLIKRSKYSLFLVQQIRIGEFFMLIHSQSLPAQAQSVHYSAQSVQHPQALPALPPAACP